MTRDDIAKTLRAICDPNKIDPWHDGFWAITQDELERFVARVEAAERETCIADCEKQIDWFMNRQISLDPLAGAREEFAINQCINAIKERDDQ